MYPLPGCNKKMIDLSAIANGSSGGSQVISDCITAAPTIGAASGPNLPYTADAPENDGPATPASPYTMQRSTVRDLTLPLYPNLDIPPSPPGSPMSGIDDKFAHFLELKRQGIHFNAKLATSAALKNPSLLPKLMQFSNIEDRQQYMVRIVSSPTPCIASWSIR